LYHAGGPDELHFTGLSVIAKDGRLISSAAYSCTWEFTFFQADDPEFDEYRSFLTARREELKHTSRDE
jgi:hypothetical protein